MKTFLLLCCLIINSPTTPVDKVMTIYELYHCEERETTAAIIIFETGYLQSYKLKKDNAQKYGNIFGFFNGKRYLRFKSYASSVLFYQGFQRRKWLPYKAKYPERTYYDFLRDLPWCSDMEKYNKVIKRIEHGN